MTTPLSHSPLVLLIPWTLVFALLCVAYLKWFHKNPLPFRDEALFYVLYYLVGFIPVLFLVGMCFPTFARTHCGY